jgi:hypothetical protein
MMVGLKLRKGMVQIKMAMAQTEGIRMSDEEGDEEEEEPNINTSELPDDGGVRAELADGEEEDKEDSE